VETLQFANAKIHDVSQNNTNNKTNEIPTEKIVNIYYWKFKWIVVFSSFSKIINARLDIDHLILNIIHTFKEKHFSLETPKISGQLLVILSINPNQYSIEANLQQLQINPINIIDPNNVIRRLYFYSSKVCFFLGFISWWKTIDY
jgi:hypothetical protein